MPKHLVVVGGTWERQWGLLGDVVSKLDDSWHRLWVDYPASFSTPEAFQDSEEIHPFTRWMSVQTVDKWAADVLSKLSLRWMWKTFPEFRDPRKLPNLVRRIHIATTAAYHYQTTGIHMQYSVRSPGIGYSPATVHIARALRGGIA